MTAPLLLLLLVSITWAVELPREAQREIDVFESGVAKLDVERQSKVNALVDKAVKALNEAARKAKTVEDRRAIDDKIISLQKMRTEGALLASSPKSNAASIVGEWLVRHKSNGSPVFQVIADGTARCGGHNGTWKAGATSVTITWDNGNSEEFLFPLTGTVIVNANGVKASSTAIRIGE